MRSGQWQSRLVGALDVMEREPHRYGQSDCLMRAGFAAAAVLDDEDPRRAEILALLERLHGTYSTMSGALRALRKEGYTPLSLIKHFFPETKPVRATSGDLGAVRTEKGALAFGTFSGPFIYVATPSGTGILPRREAVRAFEVN